MRPLSCALLLAIACACAPAGAQASFQGLGDLPGGNFHSVAAGVSADGAVVTGSSAGTFNEAFRWTQATGMVGIGDVPGGGESSQANDVSADGIVVVGVSQSEASGPGSTEAFRWTQATGMQGLGDLPGGVFRSVAHGASADGAVVVGASHSVNGELEAFRWTASGGMTGLGDLPGGSAFFSGGTSVSADGAVVVGNGTSASGPEAFRWTPATGMGGLGDLPGGTFSSSASDVSDDGTVIVGVGTSASGTEAFRWTQATGMVGLGDLPGGVFGSGAVGTSADGSVVVGTSVSASGGEAFIWTAEDGMVSLRDLLVAQGVDMTGWTLSAGAVSADGTVIVGSGTNPQGQTEAWRAVLAPSGHRWIDPTGGSWDVASNWEPASVPGPTDPVRFDLDATYTVTGGTVALGGATARAMGADDGTVDFELGGLILTSTSTGGADGPPSLSVSFDATAKIIAGTSSFVYGAIGFGNNAPGDTTTTARLQVFNAGTQLTGSGGLTVGGFQGGRGEVFVAAGSLRTNVASLGAGSIGEAVVGNGGVWTVDNGLIVGLLETGRLVIENGGGVTAATFEIGHGTDATGQPTSRVDVAGFGAGERSRLFVTDSLLVGVTGPARLRVRDGADVTAGHIVVGRNDGPRQELVVGGAITQGFDAELTATSITVGRGGTQNAYLEVRPGGAVEAERFYVGASQSSGFAFVTGTATLLARAAGFAGECEVAIGGSAGGVLTIKEGGLVTCDQASVGRVGIGRIHVGDNGGAPVASSLVVSRVLKVGEGGDGVLSLAAGVVDAVDAPSAPPSDAFDVVIFGGGRVEGTGTVVGAVDDAGELGPGVVVVPPPQPGQPTHPDAAGGVAGGTLLVMGRVAMQSSGTLAIPIAGADSTLQGRLRVTPAHGMDGSVALGGTLRLDFQNGYAPDTGDTFTLLDAASTSGGFATTQVTGLEPGWQFELIVADGSVVLNSLSDGVSTTFPTPAEPGAPAPAALVLHPPAPNPTAGTTTLRYELPAAGRVRLALYDALGREVAVLVDGDRPAGAHEATLHAGALAPGVYLLRLAAGDSALTCRMTVAR